MISSRQIAYAIDESCNEILMNGSIPTNDEVTKKYQMKFTKEPGLPFTSALNIPEFSVSDSKPLNGIFTSLLKDLIIAYDENNSQAGKILSLLNYYETEKDKIMTQLDNQNARIDAIKKYKNVYVNGDILGGHVDSFNNIDFDGDNDKGIPATTCFIDLKQGKAYNWRKRTKVDISSSSYQISVTSPVTSSGELFSFNACLQDTISEAWIYEVKSDKTNASIDVTVTLPNPVKISSIVYTTLTTRPTNIHLYLSEDGQRFVQKSDTIVTKKIAEWNFEEQTISALRFSIEKTEPDGLNGTIYEYYFASQNISLYSDSYKDNGVLVSNPMSVKNIGKATLYTKQMIYPKSAIRYFVAIDADKLDWIEIEPQTPVAVSSTPYTGSLRFMAVFYNYEHSPQLLDYLLLVEGVQA